MDAQGDNAIGMQRPNTWNTNKIIGDHIPFPDK